MNSIRKVTLGAVGLSCCVCMLFTTFVKGQSPPTRVAEQKPPMAGQVFKNVQLLKGIPVDEFMQTMGFFAASTSLNCTDCHTEESGGDWSKYADDTPLKQRARSMILIVQTLNRSSFGGKSMVTCWTCHRGSTKPSVIPDFSVQYSDKYVLEPDEIIPFPGGPSVDQIFGRYIAALGGAQRVSNIISFAASGTYSGYDTGFEKVPVDIIAKAPDQRATIVHMREGEDVTTFDGRLAWIAGPTRPIPIMELTGGNLDGARMEAKLSFPATIQQTLTNLQAGSTSIDPENKQALQVVQGRLTAGGLPVNLYFDPTSGLLVRLVRFSNTPIGVVPIQIDYSDYREVSGVKMPFHWVEIWTDGRSTVDLTELRTNVPVDSRRFGKPSLAEK